MIGIDGNEANIADRVGSNVFAFQLLNHLWQQNLRSHIHVYLKHSPLPHLPQSRANWQYRICPPSPLWTRWRLPLELYAGTPRPSVFFTPSHYSPLWSPCPRVITIFDLGYMLFPDTFKPNVRRQMLKWTATSVASSSHILTISRHTKSDIIKYYDYPEHNISVVYPGTSVVRPDGWVAGSDLALRRQYGIGGRYFLFVGTKQPRKNLHRLVEAFLRVQAKERNIFLVLAGKTWHQFADNHLLESPSIITTGYVNDQEIIKLMLGAEALVMPSLYEGFGLPVLEAMRLGVLVAAANVSALPEITGKDYPLLFNPHKTPEISATLEKILALPIGDKRKLTRALKIRSYQFSWETAAKQTMEVLNAIAVS